MFVTAGIFGVVILVMWLVRKMRFEFVFELTIVLGGLVNILGFLLANLQMDIKVGAGGVILGTIVSMLIVMIAQFFRMVLNYMSVEHVQFEDDDYYYYVKAVPKIDVAMLQKKVTTFSDEEGAEELTAAKEDEYEFDGEPEETAEECAEEEFIKEELIEEEE